MAFTRAISADLNQLWQFLAYGHRCRRERETSSRDIRVCSGVHVGEYHDVDGIDGADDGRGSAANYNWLRPLPLPDSSREPLQRPAFDSLPAITFQAWQFTIPQRW